MAGSTNAMRKAWGPVCKGPFARISLFGDGVIVVKAKAAPAFLALNEMLVKHNYKTRKIDTGAYNCRPITGGTDYSLHAYGIAADINWVTNPYGPKLITDMPIALIEDIESIRTNSGHVVFRWGGRYSGNKDAMHFEVICTPSELITGIKKLPVPVSKPVPPTAPVIPVSVEDDEMIPGFDKSPEDVARAMIRKWCDNEWGKHVMTGGPGGDQEFLLGIWKNEGREAVMTRILDHSRNKA